MSRRNPQASTKNRAEMDVVRLYRWGMDDPLFLVVVLDLANLGGRAKGSDLLY